MKKKNRIWKSTFRRKTKNISKIVLDLQDITKNQDKLHKFKLRTNIEISSHVHINIDDKIP